MTLTPPLVQLGGIVLFEGCVAEMGTGEGKTLVATLPAYLASLEGMVWREVGGWALTGRCLHSAARGRSGVTGWAPLLPTFPMPRPLRAQAWARTS